MKHAEERHESFHENPKARGLQFAQRLDNAARFLDLHSWVVAPILLVLYGYVLHHWRTKPLWYDELYTYYIAQAPTFSQMIKWTHEIDLNPPLYYIATRISFHFLHPSRFAAHLPSMVAYFVAVLCVYQFVRHRLTPAYGLIAAFVLLGSSYNLYSSEARPYAFILCFLGIVAIGWQQAIENTGQRRWLPLVAITLGGFGMLLSHVLALVAYAALLFAEFVRFFFRRKTDWILWICLLLPLFSCFLYKPLLQQHSAGIYTPVFQASIQAGFDDYSNMWIDVAPFLAIAMILSAVVNRNAGSEVDRSNAFRINWPELVFLSCLLLVPFAVVLDFMHSHTQFFPRYGIPAIFAVAVLTSYLLAWCTRQSNRAALIGTVVFLFAVVRPASLTRILQSKLEPPNVGSTQSREMTTSLNEIEPELPFVDADGLTFVAMNYRENPGFLSRVYYLVDPATAFQYTHASSFNGMPALKGKFPIHAKIDSYQQFIEKHRKFIVLGTYDYPDDWLLNKLLADHAMVRFLGKYKSDYKDHEIYEVTLAPSQN